MSSRIRSAFSPDGKTIAFERTIVGRGKIMVAALDGTGLRPLLSRPVNDTEPSWGEIAAP